MQKTVALVVGWLLAGVGAVTLATIAVGAVGDQLTDDRPASLSAAEVRSERDQSADATTSSTAPPPPTTSSTPVTVDDHGGATGGDSGSDTRGSDDHGGGGTTTTEAPPPPTSGPTAPATTTKTFTLQGGTATLRFSASGVSVVTATPKAGYQVSVEPDHGNGVRVEFENDSHRSRVSGWWDAGPRSETREDATGGGDGGGSGDGSTHG